MNSTTDPVQRFSSRVENYLRYRPGYPKGLIGWLEKECGLSPASVIADIGSGTGFLSELFLQNGNQVYGVEPNLEMRTAGECHLQGYRNFFSVMGTAESTTLPSASVDLITVGQAFHWFDRERSRQEWIRILKPKGWAVLVWNDRRTESTLFLKDYEGLLLKYATDYQTVNHKNVTGEDVASFFHSTGLKMGSLTNHQALDFEALLGRLLSSSYVPEKGHYNYELMLKALQDIFDRHQANGLVEIEYDTLIYCGQFLSSSQTLSSR